MTRNVRIVALLVTAALVAASAHAEVILTLSGTLADPTLTATVNNSDSFTSSDGGEIGFLLTPNTFDIDYLQDGPSGPDNPDEIRAPSDGSYLNLVVLSLGNLAAFTLNESHPYSTSGPIFAGSASVSELKVLNGVTSTMTVLYNGDLTGATTAVTFAYDITSSTAPEPPAYALIFGGGSLVCLSLWRKQRAGAAMLS